MPLKAGHLPVSKLGHCTSCGVRVTYSTRMVRPGKTIHIMLDGSGNEHKLVCDGTRAKLQYNKDHDAWKSGHGPQPVYPSSTPIPAPAPTTTVAPEPPTAPAPFMSDEDEDDVEPVTVPPVAAPAAPAPGSMEELIVRIVERYAQPKVDVDALVDELAGRLKATLEPNRITIIDLPNGTTVNVGHTHREFERVLWLARMARTTGKYPYLWGPAGTGKSHLARQIAEAMGVPFYYISLTPMISDTRFFGYMQTSVGNGTSSAFRTAFREAYEHGGVFCSDEFDNSSDTIVVGLNAALANKVCAFPDAIVPMHPDFVFIGTGNTSGHGGSRIHRERREIPSSTRDRLAPVYIDYDRNLERARFMEIFPAGESVLTWMWQVRDHCNVHRPELAITARGIHSVACAFAAPNRPATMTTEDTLNMYLWDGREKATIDAIVAAVGSCPRTL